MKVNEQADANIIVKSDSNWQEQVIFYILYFYILYYIYLNKNYIFYYLNYSLFIFYINYKNFNDI